MKQTLLVFYTYGTFKGISDIKEDEIKILLMMWMCLPSWNSSQRKIFFRTNLVGLEGVEPVAIENEIVKGIHVIQFECFRVCPVYLDDYDAHPRNTSLWLDGNFKLAWRGDRISFIGKTSYMSFYLCNLPITRTFTPPVDRWNRFASPVSWSVRKVQVQKELYTMSGNIRHYLAWNMLR